MRISIHFDMPEDLTDEEAASAAVRTVAESHLTGEPITCHITRDLIDRTVIVGNE